MASSVASGYALIYDKAGVNPVCLSATYRQIKEIIDDRHYQVKYLSEVPNAIDESKANPVRLFVIPGGIYMDMHKELKPLGSKITHLVKEERCQYLGICAGAIAACTRPILDAFFTGEKLIPHKEDQPAQLMQDYWGIDQTHMHLNLYTGNCCLLRVPKPSTWGSQELVTSSLSEGLKTPYPLYFQNGVFFPNAIEQPDTKVISEYAAYTFSGYHPKTSQIAQLYENRVPSEFQQLKDVANKIVHTQSLDIYQKIKPVATVIQSVGKGQILLSGLHSEISKEDIENCPALNNVHQMLKNDVINSWKDAKTAQLETMNGYLKALSISTKKA